MYIALILIVLRVLLLLLLFYTKRSSNSSKYYRGMVVSCGVYICVYFSVHTWTIILCSMVVKVKSYPITMRIYAYLFNFLVVGVHPLGQQIYCVGISFFYSGELCIGRALAFSLCVVHHVKLRRVVGYLTAQATPVGLAL